MSTPAELFLAACRFVSVCGCLSILGNGADAALIRLQSGTGPGHISVISDEFGSFGSASSLSTTFDAGEGPANFMFGSHLLVTVDDGFPHWLADPISFNVGRSRLDRIEDDLGDGERRVSRFRLLDRDPTREDLEIRLIQDASNPGRFTQRYTFTNPSDLSLTIKAVQFQDADVEFRGAFTDNLGAIDGTAAITQDLAGLSVRTTGSSEEGRFEGFVVYREPDVGAYELRSYLSRHGGIRDEDFGAFYAGPNPPPLALTNNDDLNGDLVTDARGDISTAQQWRLEIPPRASATLTVVTAIVPEPTALRILAIGCVGVPVLRRRRDFPP